LSAVYGRAHEHRLIWNGLGAANDHTGEAEALIRRPKRCREVAELLHRFVDTPPTSTSYVIWDNADRLQNEKMEALEQAAPEFFAQ
jgi:hypothetical protein